ncbi:MAG: hypothetical protein DSY90_02915 [Deltaproteobacteria bacterium]|nr:MAG: hypothetical protein DSY90_02915 [Deltaproteobacteria bacterium]
MRRIWIQVQVYLKESKIMTKYEIQVVCYVLFLITMIKVFFDMRWVRANPAPSHIRFNKISII